MKEELKEKEPRTVMSNRLISDLGGAGVTIFIELKSRTLTTPSLPSLAAGGCKCSGLEVGSGVLVILRLGPNLSIEVAKVILEKYLSSKPKPSKGKLNYFSTTAV